MATDPEQEKSIAAKPDDSGQHSDSEAEPKPRANLKKWLIRYGPIGVFLFFLIKGLIWLALGLLAWWGLRGGN